MKCGQVNNKYEQKSKNIDLVWFSHTTVMSLMWNAWGFAKEDQQVHVRTTSWFTMFFYI